MSLADPLCRRLIVKVMDEMTKYEIQYLMRAVTDLISMLFLHQFRNSRSVQNLRDPELMWSFGHFDSHLTSESFLFFRKNVLIKGSTSVCGPIPFDHLKIKLKHRLSLDTRSRSMIYQ